MTIIRYWCGAVAAHYWWNRARRFRRAVIGDRGISFGLDQTGRTRLNQVANIAGTNEDYLCRMGPVAWDFPGRAGRVFRHIRKGMTYPMSSYQSIVLHGYKNISIADAIAVGGDYSSPPLLGSAWAVTGRDRTQFR